MRTPAEAIAAILDRIEPLGESESTPLESASLADPVSADGDILVKVLTCGVCHTELDEIEGRTPPPHLPVVLGHQVVGEVVAAGSSVSRFAVGDRVGVAFNCTRGFLLYQTADHETSVKVFSPGLGSE